MRAALQLMNPVSSWTLALGCAAIFIMMLHVALDVVARLLFRQPIGGTLETVMYIYMVAIVFMPLAMVQRRRAQIIVEIFTQVLAPRKLALLDGIVAIIGCAFMVTMAWYSGHEAWAQTLIRETAPSTLNAIPIWPARWLVVIGAALVAVYLAVQAAADLHLAVRGQRAPFDERKGEGQAELALHDL